MFNKKISSDILLLVLLVVRLRLDSDTNLNDRYIRAPESREVFLGSSSAYTQITFHSPYPHIQYPHPKSLELTDLEEASILFNRLNYFNSVRERRSNLIAYYASSPGVQNVGASIENTNAEVATPAGGDSPPGNPSLPTTAEGNLESSGGTQCDADPPNSIVNDLSPEDMDLIEILWKQDIDLGVSREAFDSRQNVEVEKLKDIEYSKENLQEFYVHDSDKQPVENVTEPNLLTGLNYTVDSETGEFILDELSGLSEDEISGVLQFDNETLPSINCDSYLPCNEEDAQLSNLTDVFPPDLLSEDCPESDFLLTNFEDFEKELELLTDNDARDETMYSQPGDVFPNLDDCWPDSTTMLPLLALGNSHQNPFVSLSPRPEPSYQNNPLLPLTSNIPSRPNDGFTSILHSASMEAPTNDETFQSIPASLGPSSVGCALAESIATLHNDTDPIPSSSLINTVYNPDLPELMYTNQSLAPPHNELLIHDLFPDDDFNIAISSEGNQKVLNEHHVDTSNDSGSLASGRVPSVSDCPDWIDSCSESSSHYGENRSSSFVAQSARGNSFGSNQSSEIYHPAVLPKRQRHFENSQDAGNRDFRGASFENSSGNDPSYFSVKREYSDHYENNVAASSSQLPTYRKFDYAAARPLGAVCSSILQHNHSYHLPFSSSESQYKPVVRDKAKSTSSEEDSCNKDEKRARELNLPISIDDIINLAIEEYNERLSKYELTDQQLNLIRDIRRRGKNKVAAQNCRKRKMDQISSLQQDLDSLQKEKMQLKSKQDHLLQEKHTIEDKYAQLYQIVSQYTNCKPPGTSNPFQGHSNNGNNNNNSNSRNQMTISTAPDVIMSDDDSDLSRGARTKRKLKK